ncbi:MAG: asparagine synthase C-terminal domain-containing protein, partial [bacterium]|nr:asparagine synthase C-terminal domain-containing protein [bacterium]
IATTTQMLLHGDPRIPGVLARALLRRSRGGAVPQHTLTEMLRPDRFAPYINEPHPALYTTDVQRLRVRELQLFPIPALCQNEDRNSMFVSLESRVPLLDHVLVEFGLRLPPELLFRRGLAKYVLRAAMRGRMPEEVRWRRNKLGFPAPTQRWLGSMRHRDFCTRLTAPQRLAEVFQPAALEEPTWTAMGPRQRWLMLATDAWLGTL